MKQTPLERVRSVLGLDHGLDPDDDLVEYLVIIVGPRGNARIRERNSHEWQGLKSHGIGELQSDAINELWSTADADDLEAGETVGEVYLNVEEWEYKISTEVKQSKLEQ